MSLINPLAREVSAKVVYFGPGLSGKTTSLKYVYEAVRPERRGQLLTLATEGDRTIFFDFLPLHVKQVQGMGVRFQLYTVPGQIFYEATRRLVLNGADGVVFVADSQRAARDSNLQSFANLRENLADMGMDLERFPLVVQYNKRDLPELLPLDVLRSDVNPLGAPEFETNARTGEGILEALKEISGLVIRSLWNELPKTSPRMTPVGDLPPSHEAALTTPRIPVQSIVAELQRVAEVSGEHRLPTEDQIDADVEIAHPPSALPPPIASLDLGLSFTPLWDGADTHPIVEIEDAIRQGANHAAVERAGAALARLLESLPGTLANESPMAKAALLGLDGREYLRFCRLVTMPESVITDRDALFALYMLVSAKLKAQSI
ncbi:MAG: GTPase [Myxococcota bacterium]|nr:GTPase [Myxococcota bacterium]